MDQDAEAARLELPPEELRRLGYRVVDLLVDHLARMRELPVARRIPRPLLEARLAGPPPEAPGDPFEVLARIERDVMPFMAHIGHPRFFAFVPSVANSVSVLGDALAAGLNPFCGTWLAGPGPAEVELVTLDWLRRLCGLPEGAGGLFVSGGSVANLTALAVAREERLAAPVERGTVYFSDQTHSSVERALRVLGIRQARRLPCDAAYRLPVATLRAAIAADRAAGLFPFCVVASAGTTNTGAVDPLPALADLCAEEGLWLHVDGAYGAAAVLAERCRPALAGLERADSLSLDPHKWLFQPMEIGCVLLRDRLLLRKTFHVLPEYLQDAHRGRGPEEVNLSDYGVQLTRGFRALKLWMSIQVFGLAAFRRAVERGVELAEKAQALLAEDPRWRLVAPASLGVVCFRFAPPGLSDETLEAVNRGVTDELLAEATAFASSTRLAGRTVLRLCTINPRSTEEDLRFVLARMAEACERLLARAGYPMPLREAPELNPGVARDKENQS